jgi:hypothetical protein
VHHSAGIPHNAMLSSCGNANTSDPSVLNSQAAEVWVEQAFRPASRVQQNAGL